MGDITSRALFTFGAGTAGALALWWLWNAKSREEDQKPDPSCFQRPVAKVVKLCVYPVKSCKGLELPTFHCGVRGLKYDRCWVVVNKEGCFMTQRKRPTMALISPRLEILQHSRTGEKEEREEAILHLSAPGMPDITVKEPPDAPTEQVRVWKLFGEGVDVGREVAAWLDQYLGEEGYKMYYMSPHHKARKLLDDDQWADVCKRGEEMGFADSAPILMVSEASLQLLNTHTDSCIPMERFRANIVISGCQPHEEDEWRQFKIGDVILRNIKPCSRCKLTTVDQKKGEFTGPEPLETLGKYNYYGHGEYLVVTMNSGVYRLYEAVYGKEDSRFGPRPLFGTHCGVIQNGTLSVGDTITCKI